MTRRVRGKRVKVHLLEAPTTCPKSWKFAQTNTFSQRKSADRDRLPALHKTKALTHNESPGTPHGHADPLGSGGARLLDEPRWSYLGAARRPHRLALSVPPRPAVCL